MFYLNSSYNRHVSYTSAGGGGGADPLSLVVPNCCRAPSWWAMRVLQVGRQKMKKTAHLFVPKSPIIGLCLQVYVCMFFPHFFRLQKESSLISLGQTVVILIVMCIKCSNINCANKQGPG